MTFPELTTATYVIIAICVVAFLIFFFKAKKK